MMPFEWDVRVSSKDHTVTASTSCDEPATARYTTLWGTTEVIGADGIDPERRQDLRREVF